MPSRDACDPYLLRRADSLELLRRMCTRKHELLACGARSRRECLDRVFVHLVHAVIVLARATTLTGLEQLSLLGHGSTHAVFGVELWCSKRVSGQTQNLSSMRIAHEERY